MSLKNIKKLLVLIILMRSSIAFGQRSQEKVSIDREDYKELLLKCNETADMLALKINEVGLWQHRDSLNAAEIEGITYQLNNQKAYIKLLRKDKHKAWFNGIWQGVAIGGGVVIAVVLIK